MLVSYLSETFQSAALFCQMEPEFFPSAESVEHLDAAMVVLIGSEMLLKMPLVNCHFS